MINFSFSTSPESLLSSASSEIMVPLIQDQQYTLTLISFASSVNFMCLHLKLCGAEIVISSSPSELVLPYPSRWNFLDFSIFGVRYIPPRPVDYLLKCLPTCELILPLWFSPALRHAASSSDFQNFFPSMNDHSTIPHKGSPWSDTSCGKLKGCTSPTYCAMQLSTIAPLCMSRVDLKGCFIEYG